MPNVGNNNQSSGQQGYSANRTGTGKNTNNNDNVNSNKKSGEVYKARPEDTTKNQEQPSSSKKAAKTAAKAAGAYLGGPVGAKAVDALSKTKMGDKILNNAAKKVDRNPIMRRAAKKLDDKGAIDVADKAIDIAGSNPSAASGNSGANNGAKEASSDSSSGSTGGGMGSNFLPGPFGRKKPNFLNNDEDNKDSNKDSSFNGIFSGSLSIKVAVMVFAPALLSLLLFSTVILAASGGTSTYDDAMGVSDSTGGNTGNIGYNASSPEAKAFYERVRDVKSEYQSNGKNIDVIYIAGVFYSLQSNVSGIDYDSMSTSRIKEIADAMFKEESTTFDKDVFQDNLVNHVFLNYLPNSSVAKRKKMAKDALEYANNYKDLVREWEKGSTGDYCISSDLQADTLCKLHNEGNLAEWINQFGPVAQQDYSRTGVFASITMAQAIIESGWACSDIQNNLFGIKCNGYSTCTNVATHEEVNGQSVAITDSFRTYPSIAQSIMDHSNFLMENQRYTTAGVFSAKNYSDQAYALKRAGYATSSSYATTLINAIEQYNLSQYDVVVNTSSSGSCSGTGTSLGGWTLRTVAPTARDVAFTYKNSNRGQCVWYAQARAIEIAQDLASKGKITSEQADKIKNQLLNVYGNGGDWYNNTRGKFKGSNNIKDLKAGSIISWTQPGGYGHVAIIEDVTDRTVTVTEGWADNTTSCPNSWGCVNFRSKTVSLDDFYNSYGKYYSGSYNFSGYVYFLELEG